MCFLCSALGTDVGSLEVGKKADLIVIDAHRPHLVPALRIVSGWIHNGQAGDVESVMVDGRWLMRDRTVLTIDEADVVTRAEPAGCGDNWWSVTRTCRSRSRCRRPSLEERAPSKSGHAQDRMRGRHAPFDLRAMSTSTCVSDYRPSATDRAAARSIIVLGTARRP